MRQDTVSSHSADSSRPTHAVPVFKLYGESDPWPTPEMVHCESIAARSRLHNWQIRPHRHNGLFQILYLEKGNARVWLEDRQHRMQAGRILTVPQMCVHGFSFSRDAVGYVITLAYPLLERLSRQSADGLPALSGPQMHALPPLAGAKPAKGKGANDAAKAEGLAHIRMAFAAFDAEYRGHAPYRNVLLESLLATILAWLARAALHHDVPDSRAHPAAERTRGGEHFGRFCKLIEEHFAAQRPVSFYARQIGITAAHLNAVSRQAAGKSALELIHERLLLEAKRSLVYTSMTVSMVSDTMGFSDPAYFTRFFKRQAGMSPTEFRRRAGT